MAKIKKAVIYNMMARRIEAGDLDEKYCSYEPSCGVRVPLKIIEEPDVVSVVPLSAITHSILTRCEREDMKPSAELQLTQEEAVSASKYWLGFITPKPEPKCFSWPGETGLTFQRLPWPAAEGPTPTWDALLGRMSNKEAFTAFIGSLFVEESYAQQYCWVFGAGGEGKGCINRFLEKVFGRAYCSKQPPERGDKFWSFGLINKRIVVFPDCNNTGFTAGGVFKSLTGGDPISVEAKGEMSYVAKLRAKYLFFSNEQPSLSSERADMRRIIYCEMTPRETDEVDPTFEERLWAEGGVFIGNCLAFYRKKCPNHCAIPTDHDAINDRVEELEAEHEATLATYFDRPAVSVCTEWATGREVWATLTQNAHMNRRQIEAFLSWLKRKHNICRKKIGKSGAKAYDRLKIKPISRPKKDSGQSSYADRQEDRQEDRRED